MSAPYGRRVRTASAMLLLCFVTGCVEEIIDGSTHTYTYERWIPTLILLGGLVSISFGLALRRRSSSLLRFALLVVLPFAAFTFGPSMYFERWVVGDKQLSVRTGFWGMEVEGIVYDKLASVRCFADTTTGHRNRSHTTYYMEFTNRDGTSAKVPLDGHCSKAAAVEFLRQATARDIPVHDETHGMQ